MTPIIEVQDLIKRYKGATINAVDDISFNVSPGEFFTLLGPNGAGKTTTISILTTTLAPTAGQVRIAGYDVSRSSSEVRQNIGIIFQQPSLDFNLSAEENIRFHAILYGLYPFQPTFGMMPRAYRERVHELAALLGLENEMFKQVKKFSGGMRRKLEIIRSLLHKPRVLFLDEPTSGLDPVSRKSLWEYLTKVRRESGTTIFLTTHYLEEAEICDQVAIIDHGKIVAHDSPYDLKKRHTSTTTRIRMSAPDVLLAYCSEHALPAVREDGGVSIASPDIRAVMELVSIFKASIEDIEIRKGTLDDVFLSLTGKEIRN
jgi:ABC-2 type transport system ATP-binding protein